MDTLKSFLKAATITQPQTRFWGDFNILLHNNPEYREYNCKENTILIPVRGTTTCAVFINSEFSRYLIGTFFNAVKCHTPASKTFDITDADAIVYGVNFILPRNAAILANDLVSAFENNNAAHVPTPMAIPDDLALAAAEITRDNVAKIVEIYRAHANLQTHLLPRIVNFFGKYRDAFVSNDPTTTVVLGKGLDVPATPFVIELVSGYLTSKYGKIWAIPNFSATTREFIAHYVIDDPAFFEALN
jgi:hypothetical protein